MPEYLYPGVYVEEIDTRNKPIEGVSTSTVGFLGIAERGPVKPTLITSFVEYTRTFGGYVRDADGTDHYLAYAVEGFFQNGGKRCFVQRVVHTDRVIPANSSKASSIGVGNMRIDAIGPGSWGNNVAVQVSDAGLDPTNLFKLTVFYWAGSPPADIISNPTMTEVFDNLSSTAGASTFYESEINEVSNLIMVKQTGAGRPTNNPGAAVLNHAGIPLQLFAGTDGSPAGGKLTPDDFKGDDRHPENKTGLVALGDVAEISILCCPDEFYLGANNFSVAGYLKDQCELMKDRFAILQAPVNAGKTNDPSENSNYAAYYYPWLKITNPLTGVPLLIPPGGHVAGIYARTDTKVGVHKAPANEVINGISELQLQTNDQQQTTLNAKGVNVLRYFKGAGNLVWSGRTTSRDANWKYINVRRLFIFIEKSILRGTQWVVFETNDEPLWGRVRRTISDFLYRLWLDGMLQGAKTEQAFFVKCDRTTMTQADIDNGRVICIIGIAPVKPAEFVIFRIGQWHGGSEVQEG